MTKCDVQTITVVNAADQSPYDPNVFDIVIDKPNYKITFTVKQNIDDSLAGEYKLTVIQIAEAEPDIKWIYPYPLTVQLVQITDCVPTVTPPTKVLPYYKYFLNANGVASQHNNGAMFQGIKISYLGFSYGYCDFTDEFVLTCEKCGLTDSAQVLNYMHGSEVKSVTTVDPINFNSFSVTTPAEITIGATLSVGEIGSYNVTYRVFAKPPTSAPIYSFTSEVYVTQDSCNQDAQIDRALYPLPGTNS